MSEVNSYITNEEFSNIKIHVKNYSPSGYIIVRFELPFHVPVTEDGGFFSKKLRKGIKVKHIYIEREGSDIPIVHSNVEVFNILIKPITFENQSNIINEIFVESLKFLNNIIKILITRFQYKHLQPINRFDLPGAVPMWVCNQSQFDDKKLIASIFVNFHFNKLERSQTLLTRAENNELIARVEHVEENPYWDLTVLFSEGSNLLRAGDFNSGFLKLHSCTERIMYKMVEEIFLKKGKSQDKIAQIPYKNLLTQHLGPYLTKNGFLFNIDDSTSIAYEYWEKVYKIRNKAVHLGYRVTEEDSIVAHELLWKLNKSVIITMKKLDYPNIEKYLTDTEESLTNGYKGFY